MQTKIVEKLKTLSITNVVPFGVKSLPSAPYTVVKQEKDTAGRGIVFRIIAHFLPGQNIFLQDYLLGEVLPALNKFSAIDRNGNTNHLKSDDWNDIVINNDDGTISMEITFIMPMVPIMQY